MQFSRRHLRLNRLRHICFVLAFLLTMMCLFGCSDSPPLGSTDTTVEQTPQIILTEADVDTNEDNAVPINLSEFDYLCLINQPGTYIVSGELTGYIQIDVQDQIVHLILDNVIVNASAGPALEVLSASKVILTARDSTTNIFRDSADYPRSTEADACIYSTCDLTINGKGILNVSGYFKDAIHTKDVLKILNDSTVIQSKRDGLHGNDGIIVCCQSLSVQSERNGLYSTKTGNKPAKGNVEIYDSNCSIIGGKYAISCAANLYIANADIYTTGIYGDLEVLGTSYIDEGSVKIA